MPRRVSACFANGENVSGARYWCQQTTSPTSGLPAIVQNLNKTRLTGGIAGYPNAVAVIAAFILDTGAKAPAVGTVMTGGAELRRHDRELISEAFGTEPYSNYGAYEAFAIACECEAHNGLHIAAEDLVVEIVDEAGMPVSAGAKAGL